MTMLRDEAAAFEAMNEKPQASRAAREGLLFFRGLLNAKPFFPRL
jgi:hypothetical protein